MWRVPASWRAVVGIRNGHELNKGAGDRHKASARILSGSSDCPVGWFSEGNITTEGERCPHGSASPMQPGRENGGTMVMVKRSYNQETSMKKMKGSRWTAAASLYFLEIRTRKDPKAERNKTGCSLQRGTAHSLPPALNWLFSD